MVSDPEIKCHFVFWVFFFFWFFFFFASLLTVLEYHLCIYYRNLFVDNVFLIINKSYGCASMPTTSYWLFWKSRWYRRQRTSFPVGKPQRPDFAGGTKRTRQNIRWSRGLETHTGGFVSQVTDSDPDRFAATEIFGTDVTSCHLWMGCSPLCRFLGGVTTPQARREKHAPGLQPHSLLASFLGHPGGREAQRTFHWEMLSLDPLSYYHPSGPFPGLRSELLPDI